MPGVCQWSKVSATSLSKSGVNGEASEVVNGIWWALDKTEKARKKLAWRSNIFKVSSDKRLDNWTQDSWTWKMEQTPAIAKADGL